ncbi:PAQR family membrane homeostasis protein TrhA [Planktotalea arctica]|uniref:PAQR family membrane homeostasis protein TrhA n=1 Tax=Planktotalea arctica TaxID=1481893 RepID=UPI000A1774E2|nr:hemolysin III family protein [Planktotalea arctica]
MYPSPILSNRRADMLVHGVALTAILIAGTLLLTNAYARLSPTLFCAVFVYVLCALASNQASCFYHFAPWHARRTLLRRIDHAAIYLSITGTFTPLLVQAGTPRTYIILALCWALALLAIWNKITNPQIKSRWSTASYLALGAIGLLALPDLKGVPAATTWCILAGSASYAIGTIFYARKTLPFRYAIWHSWVSLGGMFMYAGIWLALF